MLEMESNLTIILLQWMH